MANRPALSPPKISKDLAVNVHKVHGWIRSGELRAVNVGDKQRPRWRILAEDLDAFLARRAATPAAKPARRKRKADPNVIEFF